MAPKKKLLSQLNSKNHMVEFNKVKGIILITFSQKLKGGCKKAKAFQNGSGKTAGFVFA
jgi:hypothetical protein